MTNKPFSLMLVYQLSNLKDRDMKYINKKECKKEVDSKAYDKLEHTSFMGSKKTATSHGQASNIPWYPTSYFFYKQFSLYIFHILLFYKYAHIMYIYIYIKWHIILYNI